MARSIPAWGEPASRRLPVPKRLYAEWRDMLRRGAKAAGYRKASKRPLAVSGQ